MNDMYRGNSRGRIIDISNGYLKEDNDEDNYQVTLIKRDWIVYKIASYVALQLSNIISMTLFIISKLTGFMMLSMYTVIREYRVNMGFWWLSRYDRKYSQENLFILSLQLPETIKENSYIDTKMFYPFLTERALRDVIRIRKDKIKYYKKIWSGTE